MGGISDLSPGEGVEDKLRDDGDVVVVGYAFMAKKMDSMRKVRVRRLTPVLPLFFCVVYPVFARLFNKRATKKKYGSTPCFPSNLLVVLEKIPLTDQLRFCFFSHSP